MHSKWLKVLTSSLVICGLVATEIGLSTAQAQIEFRLALEKKYDKNITVTCNACHVALKPKTVRNETFGKELEKALAGKMVSKRLEDVKKLPIEDPAKVKVKEEVTAEFLEALKKVEALKAPAGATYGELIKQGKLDGVKLKD